MEYIEGFANNKGVNIYYIDNGVKDSKKNTIINMPWIIRVCKGLYKAYK